MGSQLAERPLAPGKYATGKYSVVPKTPIAFKASLASEGEATVCQWTRGLRIHETCQAQRGGWLVAHPHSSGFGAQLYGDLFFDSSKSIESLHLSPTFAASPPTRLATTSVTCRTSRPAGRNCIAVGSTAARVRRPTFALESTHDEHVTNSYERVTDSERADLPKGGPPRPARLPDAFLPSVL